MQYLELLKSKIERGLITTANESDKAASSTAVKEQDYLLKPPSIKDVQEKVRNCLINARIFERAIKLFQG